MYLKTKINNGIYNYNVSTMIIFGLFLIIGENVNHFVDNLKLQQGFQVFMKEDAHKKKWTK